MTTETVKPEDVNISWDIAAFLVKLDDRSARDRALFCVANFAAFLDDVPDATMENIFLSLPDDHAVKIVLTFVPDTKPFQSFQTISE